MTDKSGSGAADAGLKRALAQDDEATTDYAAQENKA